jgi:hypothetical protein
MLTLAATLLLAATPDPNLYKVKTSLAPAQTQVGQSTKLAVQFDVAKDAHISDEAPLTIKLSGEGVTFEKPVLHYADSLQPRGPGPKFEELLTPTSPGSHTVEIDMSFYVCTAELCNRATDHQKVTIAAK